MFMLKQSNLAPETVLLSDALNDWYLVQIHGTGIFALLLLYLTIEQCSQGPDRVPDICNELSRSHFALKLPLNGW